MSKEYSVSALKNCSMTALNFVANGWPAGRQTVSGFMAGFESDVTAGSSRGVDIAQWGALRNRTKLPGPRLLRAAAPVIAPESGTLQSNNQRQARGHWYFTPLPPPCIPSLLVRRRRGRRENKKKGEKKGKRLNRRSQSGKKTTSTEQTSWASSRV